jgi:hypothetical protein
MRELSASHGAEMWELLDILTYVIKYDFVINVKDEDTFCSYRESFNRVPRSTIVKNPRNSFDRVHRAFGTLTDLIMGLITAGLIQSPDYFKYINQAISGNELKNDDDILDFTDEVLCGMCSDMYQAISSIPDNNVQHALDNKILENIMIRFIQLLENPGADDNNYVIGMLYTLIASIYTSIYDHCIKAIQKGKSPVLASIKYDEEAYDMRIDADKKFMDLFESISYMEKMKIKFGEIISNGGNLKQEIKSMGKMNKK